MRAALLAMLLLYAAPVVAQDLVGKPPTEDFGELQDERRAPDPQAPSDDERRLAEGERQYAEALQQHAEGAGEYAESLLARLIRDYPDHPRAPEARVLLAQWTEERTTRQAAEAAELARTRELQQGRTMLALGQGLHGFALGLEIWHLAYESPFQDSDVVVGLGLGGLGATAGIATSLALASDGIERGHAAVLSSGPLWGFFLGYTASRANYGIRDRGRVVTAMIGQVAGLGAGELAWRLWKPTRGQMWIVDSTAFWTTLLGTTTVAGVTNYGFPPERPILAGTHFWTGTFGLVAGGLLATAAPELSTGRVMIVNLVGLGGAFLGGAIATAASQSEPSASAWGVTIGAPIGLALGAWAIAQSRPTSPKPSIAQE